MREDFLTAYDPKKPMASIEAEAVILGVMMMDSRFIDQALESLVAEDFYEPVHEKVFRLIVSFTEEGKAATPVTLRPIVQRDPLFKELGGASYLAKLTSSPGGMIGFKTMVQQVAEFSRMREIAVASELALEEFLEGVPVGEATARLEDAIGKAVQQVKPVRVNSARGMMRRVKERSQRLTDEALGQVGPQCATISDLNALFGPLEGGMLVIVAGRPGMGKTTLACSAAWGYAANGNAVEYYAAEGTEDTLAMRFASDMSLSNGHPIPHAAIRNDKLTPEDRAHLDLLEERAESLPINFQVIKRIDVRRLRSYVARAVARWKAKGRKLELVFVDYLQLLTASVRGRDIDDDRKRVSAISSALLDIAKEFDLVVVALSQLSRAVEQRPDKRPQMSDLRESGQIEQDADIVLLLYRLQHYLEHEKPQEGTKNYREEVEAWDERLRKCRDRVDLILGKNRHGEAKTRTAKFYGKYYAIRGGDYAPDDDTFRQDNTLF